MTTPNENAVLVGGFWVDPDTGEVLGCAEIKQEFAVRDRGSAEWALEKMQNLEADLLALEAREKAIREAIDSQRKDLARRREWLGLRFDAELEAFARETLAMGKSRTLKLDHGRLSLRTVPERVALREGREKEAIDWARSACPEAVKTTERLLASIAIEKVEALPDDLFERVPEHDTFRVDTGIKAEPKA
ncbi:MAG: host-nuclease inhibitor Gam family protein [bacterium]